MIPVKVQCPHCQAHLMDEEALIDGYPAICLDLLYQGDKVPLRLSAIYGSFRYDTSTAVDAGDLTQLACPECHRSIVTDSPCQVCNAPLAVLHLTVGGDVLFCSRRGCKYHRAESNDLERSMIELTR